MNEDIHISFVNDREFNENVIATKTPIGAIIFVFIIFIIITLIIIYIIYLILYTSLDLACYSNNIFVAGISLIIFIVIFILLLWQLHDIILSSMSIRHVADEMRLNEHVDDVFMNTFVNIFAFTVFIVIILILFILYYIFSDIGNFAFHK